MTNLQLQLIPRNEEQEIVLNSLSTYTEKYNFIIDHYKKFPDKLDCYCEVHHIVPKSCNGTDDPDNLVKLPAAIHYLVHFLLPLMMEESGDIESRDKMLYAFSAFSRKIRGRRIISSDCIDILAESKEFSELRAKCKEARNNPKYKRNRSLGQKKRYSRPEEHEKSRIRKLGKPMSEDARIHMSQFQKKRYEDQEERMKHSLPGEKNGMYGRRGENSVPHQMHWIKNETTGESKYVWKSEPIPDGWASGRFNPYDRTGFEKCWITNGTEDKLVSKDKPIPDGWRHGMSFSSRPAYGKAWITNGTENALIDKDSPIPEGWHRGQSKSKPTGGSITKGMFWINNGVEQRLSKGDIPDGWARGRIRRASY